MRKRANTTGVLAITVAAALLALGACGGSEEAGPTASPGPRVTAGPEPPQNAAIAFARYTNPDGVGDIVVMRADGSGETNLTRSSGISEGRPAWSPDGTLIAYTRQVGRFSDLWVMNADGSAQRNLTKTPGVNEDEPAWSPDGDRIAFTSGEVNGDVFVMDAAGGEPINLTKSPDRSEASPAWSPDGKRIAFSSNAVYVVNADGSGETKLTAGLDVIIAAPAFSPDGEQIAFFGQAPGSETGRAWTMSADGSGAAPLAQGPRLDPSSGPEFSPDGRLIAFEGDDPGPGIYVMNADGSKRVRLTKVPNDQAPAWNPAHAG
jgi:TolB protein